MRFISPNEGNITRWFLSSALGRAVTRPWLDALILRGLKRYFFPLSRLWACASVASDGAQFSAVLQGGVSEGDRQKLDTLLKKNRAFRQAAELSEQAWQRAMFANSGAADRELTMLERNRLHTRDQFNRSRRHFMAFRRRVSSSVLHRFPTPSAMQTAYGEDGNVFEDKFAPPSIWPTIETSSTMSQAASRCYWVRFTSPAEHLQDPVYAKVHEPIGVENPPTLIFGHGICVEADHWRGLVDPTEILPQMGIRVIRPEGAWHGRRAPSGYFGGEYFLATSPQGAFDYFTAQHKEWAVLIDYARRTSRGPVALGGSSLGAQSAQATAIRACRWPRRLQPDALFLVTHCQHVWEVALDGALADIWGLHDPLYALGWDRESMKNWLSRLDPVGVPCVNPDNIVSVIGLADTVTPYASGLALQRNWGLPEENTFCWNSGHFTVPMRLLRQQQPLWRLKAILESAKTAETA